MKNLCVRETYQGKDGNEKVKWSNVGVLIESAKGKQYVKLSMFPDLLIHVFEQKQDNQPNNQPNQPQNNDIDDINDWA